MVVVSIIAFFTMLNLQHNSPAVILGYMGRKSPLQPKQFFCHFSLSQILDFIKIILAAATSLSSLGTRRCGHSFLFSYY